MSSCFNRPARRMRSRTEVEREEQQHEEEEEVEGGRGAGTGDKARMLGQPGADSILHQRQEQKKCFFLFFSAERLFFSGSFSRSGSSWACWRWKRRC